MVWHGGADSHVVRDQFLIAVAEVVWGDDGESIGTSVDAALGQIHCGGSRHRACMRNNRHAAPGGTDRRSCGLNAFALIEERTLAGCAADE